MFPEIVLGNRASSRNCVDSIVTARIRRMGKVMFSVCPHLGGGVYPARSSRGGVPRLGTPPGRTGGYPVRTTKGVLTTRRAVCLLRSRRRTFLLFTELGDDKIYGCRKCLLSVKSKNVSSTLEFLVAPSKRSDLSGRYGVCMYVCRDVVLLDNCLTEKSITLLDNCLTEKSITYSHTQRNFF